LCHTTQQRAAPTIFPLNLQTITIIGCCLAEGREADIYGAEYSEQNRELFVEQNALTTELTK